MNEYRVIITTNDLISNELINTNNYNKALKIYKEAKKQKPFYVALCQESGDKLIALKNKWFK